MPFIQNNNCLCHLFLGLHTKTQSTVKRGSTWWPLRPSLRPVFNGNLFSPIHRPDNLNHAINQFNQPAFYWYESLIKLQGKDWQKKNSDHWTSIFFKFHLIWANIQFSRVNELLIYICFETWKRWDETKKRFT